MQHLMPLKRSDTFNRSPKPHRVSVLLALAAITLLPRLGGAAGFELHADAPNQPFYRSLVPASVYTADTRNQPWFVVNGAGEPVPYSRVNAATPTKSRYQYVERAVNLPVFPLTAKKLATQNTQLDVQWRSSNGRLKPNGDTAQLHLVQTQAAAKIEQSPVVYLLRNKPLNTPNESANMSANVSDNTAINDSDTVFQTVQSFSLQWRGAGDALIEVEVLASDDLHNFQRVGSGTLVNLKQGGERVVSDRIVLNTPSHARYFQIKLVDSNSNSNADSDARRDTSDDFVLSRATANTLVSTAVSADTASPLALPSLPLTQTFTKPAMTRSSTQVFYEFQTQVSYPAHSVQLNLPQINTTSPVTIYTRDSLNQPWEALINTTVYRLVDTANTAAPNDTVPEKTNAAITLPPNVAVARYWRIETSIATGGLGAGLPSLTFMGLAQTLVWNARGAGPFKLLVAEPSGTNAAVAMAAGSVPLAQLLPNYTERTEQALLNALPSATLAVNTAQLASDAATTRAAATAAQLAAAEKLKADTAKSASLKIWLWLGLGLSVALLAAMAYSLLRQNKAGAPSEKL